MDTCFKILFLFTITSGNIVNYVEGISSFNMLNNCDDELSMILSSVYQLELTLQGSVSESCETQIEAWNMYPKLMFYFDEMDLDCDKGHLEFYTGRYGSTRVEGLEWDVCGEDKPEGVFTVHEMVMHVKYVPKRRAYLYDDVSIIVTAFSDEDSCPYGHFVCDNSRCLDDSLQCNDHNPCGDSTDCPDTIAAGIIAVIVIGNIGAICCIVALVVCCCCCLKKKQIKNPGTVQGAPYVVYSTQQTGQNQQGMAHVSLQNPSYYSPAQGTYPSAPYTNITTGQQPMYPPNVSIPAYRPEVEQNPPSYDHLFGDLNNTSQAAASGVTAPARYDNMPSSAVTTIDVEYNSTSLVTTDADKNETENVYETVEQPSGEHTYDNPQVQKS